MTDESQSPPPPEGASSALDLQALLYRQIGISAVAAALRFISQPDPSLALARAERDQPAILRDEDLAA